MDRQIVLRDVNLCELQLSNDGSSLSLYLKGSVPPYSETTLQCIGLFLFSFHRMADEDAPYYAGYLECRPLQQHDAIELLNGMRYFVEDFNSQLHLLPTVYVHVEGGVWLEVLASDVTVEER